MKLKRSDLISQLFTGAIIKPTEMNGCWKRLGEQFDPVVLGDSCKIKYNQLFSKFRNIKTELQRSEAGSNHWRYLRVFKNTFSKNTKTEMKSVVELGDKSFSKIVTGAEVIENETEKRTIKRNTKTLYEYKQLKIDALLCNL
ncbi:hypothetical protein CDIK_4080 [Cucumispora dikerogammari]|nr:hypothetical protein CDIK_4080 [Cucumispora dikerogammari]